MKIRKNQIYTHKEKSYIKLLITSVTTECIEYRFLTKKGWMFSDKNEYEPWSNAGKRLKLKETLLNCFKKTGYLKEEKKEVFINIKDLKEEETGNNFLKKIVYKQKQEILKLQEMYRDLEYKYNKNYVIPKNKKAINTKSTRSNNTFIYVMIDENTNLYKIGRSIDPNKRERTLQSEKPTIKMIFAKKGTNKDESNLHNMFKEKRVRGEWFNLNDTDIQKVKLYLN